MFGCVEVSAFYEFFVGCCHAFEACAHGLGLFFLVELLSFISILGTLFKKEPLQDSDIAKCVGIAEQWCNEKVNALHDEDLIESQFIVTKKN